VKKACVILSAIALLLSSCSLGGGIRSDFFKDDSLVAYERLEKILEALESKNKQAMTSLFSKQALDEANDFDAHMDYLFEFFQGEVESHGWNRNTGGPITDGRYDGGNKMKELKSWFDVVTDKESYIFFLLDYPVDTFDSNNVGLYSLRVVKTSEEDTLTYWTDMKIAGIYKPEE